MRCDSAFRARARFKLSCSQPLSCENAGAPGRPHEERRLRAKVDNPCRTDYWVTVEAQAEECRRERPEWRGPISSLEHGCPEEGQSSMRHSLAPDT